MPIKHVYGPAAGTLAGVAGAIGTGRGNQDAAKQRAEFDRMTLGALLQDRSQQADFNFRAAGMYQGAQQQNAQMQNDLQRQQIAMNMGANQSAYDAALKGWGMEAGLAQNAWQNQEQLAQQGLMNEQRIDLQRELGFAELDKETQLAELRMRPEASPAWQKIQAEEDAIRRARTDGFLTQPQFEEAMANHAQSVVGFDINKFQKSEWQAEYENPDGSKSMGTYQTGPNGQSVPTFETQRKIDAKWNAWEESQKPQGKNSQWQADNASADNRRLEEAAVIKQYNDAAQHLFKQRAAALGDSMEQPKPPTHDEVVAFVRQQRSMVQEILGGSGPGNVPSVAPSPMLDDTAMRVQKAQEQWGQPQQQSQGPQQLPPPRQAFGLGDLNPVQVAVIAVEQQPEYVMKYLDSRYQSVKQIAAGGNPDDIALATQLSKALAQGQ